jgi:hypothetical protein
MKKMAIIMSVLMLIAFTAGITLAAGARTKAAKVETIQCNVVKVDAAAGQIVVSVQNKEQTLKAGKELLGSVKAGDKVIIVKTGDTVTSIKVVK